MFDSPVSCFSNREGRIAVKPIALHQSYFTLKQKLTYHGNRPATKEAKEEIHRQLVKEYPKKTQSEDPL